MAKHIDINGSSARGLSFGANISRSARIGGGSGMPKYVGAEAEVSRVAGGVRIWLKDYKGTTEEIISEAIADIITNPDSSLTFVLPDGREIRTEPLKGELPLYYDTTEGWDSQTTLISEAGAIYVYTDHAQVDDKDVPGIKLGDGSSYLIDIPYIDSQYIEHIHDTTVHITEAERQFWNNKNRATIMGETLIITDI